MAIVVKLGIKKISKAQMTWDQEFPFHYSRFEIPLLNITLNKISINSFISLPFAQDFIPLIYEWYNLTSQRHNLRNHSVFLEWY